ncbi:MAG: transporter substrate-binding domain-containing protein [Acidobacteriota bacterium]
MTRVLALALTALALLAAPVMAGDTYEMIKKRGELRCGVGDAVPGLSMRGPGGTWQGMEIDFARAVAAAVFGDPAKAAFLPLETAGRFPALLAKQVDLLGRNTSWTLGREAKLRVSFAGPLLFTAQAVMTRKADAVKDVKGLDGAKLCLSKGTTHAQGLSDLSAMNEVKFEPVLGESTEKARDLFLQGQCKALIADRIVLAGFQSQLGEQAGEYEVFAVPGTAEIISPVVRADDNEWRLAVSGVLAALVHAEAAKLTRERASALLKGGAEAQPDEAARKLLRDADGLAKPLGMPPGWALRAIAAAGNIGEMFERNVGAESQLKFDRRFNRPWYEGGLMYAPPF